MQFDNQDGAYKSMMNQAARFRDEPQIMWFQITMSYFPENKESEGLYLGWNMECDCSVGENTAKLIEP